MGAVKSLHAIEILMVEDSPTDRLIAIEALQSSKLINCLNVVENGVDAMAYLRREGKFRDARRPDLVLLDLNLPKKDGREVLDEIKNDPLLKFIPVVVLTTSKSDEDLLRAYGSHANSYITKPVDFPQFTDALRSLGGYWFEVVTLPPEAALERLARVPPARPAPAPVPNSGNTAVRLLLVEDNLTDVVLMRDALAENQLVNFELVHESRAADACERLRAETFDLVMADLGLPDSSGLDTYRRLRAVARGIPVIVLTGLDDEEVGILALREGAQDYLVKGQLTARALARAARYAIDKKQHQEELRQSQRLEAVGRLAAGVAHDFNNILTVIRCNAELLSLGVGHDDEGSDAPAEILEAADRAIGLARQLLTFSRQEAMNAKPLDLNQTVGNFTRMIRRLLGDQVRLELHLTADPTFALADVGMLEQVLMNLAVNARDAMPGGGKITIKTAVQELTPAAARAYAEGYAGKFVRMTVTDTGAGIAPDALSRIFEPFFTTKTAGQGTGLGLATVHGIVEQHRGWVGVTSQVGFGTTFEVFLPCTERRPVRSIPPPAASPVTAAGTVLLVEDELALQSMAARVLRRQGCRVLVASSALEAMNLWATEAATIDLLFTDLVLHDGHTGREVAERLLAARPSLKVVFTSGYSADFTSSDFVLEQGVNFLHKPYAIGQLVDIVKNCLARGQPS
ncbi:MAG: response regulator [Polyangiaceae bacterium]